MEDMIDDDDGISVRTLPTERVYRWTVSSHYFRATARAPSWFADRPAGRGDGDLSCAFIWTSRKLSGRA